MNLKREPQQNQASTVPLGYTDDVVRSLYLGLFVMLLLVIAVLVAHGVRVNKEEHIRELLKLDNDLTDLFSTVQDAETGQRGYLLTSKPYYLDPFHTARDRSQAITARMVEHVEKDLLSRKELDQLKALISRKHSELDRTIRLFDEGRRAESMNLVDTDLGNKLMQEIRLRTRAMSENFRLEREKDERFIRNVNILILSTISIAVIVLMVVFYRIYGALQPLLDKIHKSYHELKEGRASLAEKNRELEHFAYIASHDLNEPLRTINSFVGILEEEHRNDFTEDSREYFGFINAATTRMRGLIDGLINYSRLGQSASFQVCDLNLIVRDLQKDLGHLIEEKQAVIECKTLPVIMCLKTEVRQLFQHLILNALIFTDRHRRPFVRIVAKERRTHWEFRLSDNGIGIPEHQQSKIFNVFTRLHLPTRFPGQGIGLALAKKIVELHEGELWVSSVPGKGSDFCFTLKKNLTDESQAE